MAKATVPAASYFEKETNKATQSHPLYKDAYDLVVIGGGSSGLAAAYAASASGVENLLIIEREHYLGGVLPQCVHDGFGLHLYKQSLTGPEYAQKWIDLVSSAQIERALESTVVDTRHDEATGLFHVDVIGAAFRGFATLVCRSLICATGCRERTRGSLRIPGGRPAGLVTAGTAQYMVNVANQLPGDKVVILGSGDIGLIMARRMVLEGTEVRMVLGQEATGLVRNHIRCIKDFDIPIRFGWGIVSIHGYGQLQGLTIAPILEDGSYDLARKEYLRCNVLFIACGLIPEREALKSLGAPEQVSGLYLCGNAKAPHDLVDQVTQEGLAAGFDAACYIFNRRGEEEPSLPSELIELTGITIEEPKGKIGDFDTADIEGGRLFVCTVCPKGCVVRLDDSGSLVGHSCPRGREYAENEAKRPTRMFTGTVKIKGRGKPSHSAAAASPTSTKRLLSVRTSKEVPKQMLVEIAKACRKIHISTSVQRGEALARNIAGTDADLIATSDYCAG